MSDTVSTDSRESGASAPDPANKKGRGRRAGRGRSKDAAPEEVSNAQGAAATRARVAGGSSNRTEITITSFDFLGGAYALATRARRIALVFLLLLGVLLGYMVMSVVSTMSAASSAEAEAEQWKQRETEVIASFGQAAGINVDQRLAIERQQALEEALVTIAAGQFDLSSAMGELNTVVVPGAAPVEFRAGFLAVTANELSTLDPAKGAPAEVLAAADGYLQGVEWAAGVAALPGFYDSQAFPEGAQAVLITSFIPLGTPPAVLVQRLADLGIVYETPREPMQATAPESAKKAASEAKAGEGAASAETAPSAEGEPAEGAPAESGGAE